jgi:hypothetical protein
MRLLMLFGVLVVVKYLAAQRTERMPSLRILRNVPNASCLATLFIAYRQAPTVLHWMS